MGGGWGVEGGVGCSRGIAEGGGENVTEKDERCRL